MPPGPVSLFEKPYDIYLTENRVCKKCVGRVLNDPAATEALVELKNKKGDTGVYRLSEIIGVDNHPVARKLFLQSLHGIGFPAQIIVPQGFDDTEKLLNY